MSSSTRINEIASRKKRKGKKVRVGLYLSSREYVAVRDWCESRGSSVSEVIDVMLEELILEYKIEVPEQVRQRVKNK